MKKVIDLGKIGITLAGEYNDKTIYEKLTIVLYKGKSYISTKTVQGISPVQDIRSWQLVAEAKDAYHMLVDAGKTTLTEDEFLEQLVDATKGRYIVQGNVINGADEEDLTIEHSDILGIDTLKLADRPSTDGMGYVILRKNKPFAKQVIKENTIYEIRYNFNLEENDVEIPSNCVLKFVGGKISNGTLVGNITQIDSEITIIFSNIVFSGSFITKFVYPEWFDRVDEYWNESIQSAIDLSTIGGGIVVFSQPIYMITGSRLSQGSRCLIVVKDNVTLYSECKSQLKLAKKSYVVEEDYEAVLGNAYAERSWSINVVIRGICINQEFETLIEPSVIAGARGNRCIVLYKCVNVVIDNCSFYTKGSNAICLVTNDTKNFNANTGNKVINNEIVFLKKEYDQDQSGMYLVTSRTIVENNIIKDEINVDFPARGGIEFHGSFLTATNNTIYGVKTGFNVSPHRGVISARNIIIANNNMTNGKCFVRIWPEGEYIEGSIEDNKKIELINTAICNNVCTYVERFFHVFCSDERYKAKINGLLIDGNTFIRGTIVESYIFGFSSLGQVENIRILNNTIYNSKYNVLGVSDSNTISGESVAGIKNFLFTNNSIYGCFEYESSSNNEKPLFYIGLAKTPIDYNAVIIRNNIIDISASAKRLPYILRGKCIIDDNIFSHEVSVMTETNMSKTILDVKKYVPTSKVAKVGDIKTINNINYTCINFGVDKTGTFEGTLCKEVPYPMILVNDGNSIEVGDIINVSIGSLSLTNRIVFSKVGNKISIGYFGTSGLEDNAAVTITYKQSEWTNIQGVSAVSKGLSEGTLPQVTEQDAGYMNYDKSSGVLSFWTGWKWATLWVTDDASADVGLKAGTASMSYTMNGNIPRFFNSSLNKWLDANGFDIAKRWGGIDEQPSLSGSNNIACPYYDATNNQPLWWAGSKGFLKSDGSYSRAKTYGTWAEKPTTAIGVVPVGYQYLCTDKISAEDGSTCLIIFHKGNDIWVDALGRIIE